MEREKRRIRAEMARKAMEKELQEVHGLLVGQEGVLEGVGGDRNKLWRQLQVFLFFFFFFFFPPLQSFSHFIFSLDAYG